MAGIPLSSFIDALSARRDARTAVQRDVRVSIMVCEGASRALAQALKEGMRPETSGARLHIEGFSYGSGASLPAVNALCDFSIVVVGDTAGQSACAALWRGFASVGVPCAVVGCYEDEAGIQEALESLIAGGVNSPDILLDTDASYVINALGDWVASSLPDDVSDAAAAGFPCCRDARARAVVSQISRANALAAVLGVLPTTKKADMVVMTGAQVAMVMRLAALYGRPLDGRFARALVPVVAVAPLWRGVARGLTKHLPLPGIAVRSGVGASATAAIGRVAIGLLSGTSKQTGER